MSQEEATTRCLVGKKEGINIFLVACFLQHNSYLAIFLSFFFF